MRPRYDESINLWVAISVILRYNDINGGVSDEIEEIRELLIGRKVLEKKESQKESLRGAYR